MKKWKFETRIRGRNPEMKIIIIIMKCRIINYDGTGKEKARMLMKRESPQVHCWKQVSESEAPVSANFFIR